MYIDDLSQEKEIKNAVIIGIVRSRNRMAKARE